ncbi:hypothetical protein ARMGADRAFT_1161394 [Armillaria gallica]|uniref:Uncharacterized protein n=1 Tax=Armillaria gallica TaxID=47427 RepID=A0A2H3EF32_ARMGA|nr:hypothetical protein ARMGADRAFT_1161394 [Armillaria gallica]
MAYSGYTVLSGRMPTLPNSSTFTRVAANFEAIYAVDLFIYARRMLIMDKITRARSRCDYELYGDRMFDPEAGGSEHFLALGPPPPPYVQ